jgi:hypothetical protein
MRRQGMLVILVSWEKFKPLARKHLLAFDATFLFQKAQERNILFPDFLEMPSFLRRQSGGANLHNPHSPTP